MIKLDIVNQVADKTGVPKQKAEQVVDSLFNAMKEALARGKRIELRGFGVFVVKPRKRGVGRNPRTGERKRAKATAVPRFRAGTDLKAYVSGAKKVPRATAKKATSGSAAASRTTAAARKTVAKAPAKKTTAKKTAAKR